MLKIVFALSSIIQKKVLEGKGLKKIGLMIDKSTDISVKGHFVVYATFLKGNLPITTFLGLLWIEGEKRNSQIIFEILVVGMKTRVLNLNNCVVFGSDGVSTMVRKIQV